MDGNWDMPATDSDVADAIMNAPTSGMRRTILSMDMEIKRLRGECLRLDAECKYLNQARRKRSIADPGD